VFLDRLTPATFEELTAGFIRAEGQRSVVKQNGLPISAVPSQERSIERARGAIKKVINE